MTLNDVKIIQLPKFPDQRGNLSFFENGNQIPFSISRCYWIYDVPGGEQRGGHAYRSLQEFIIALSGSFDVVLDDGAERRTFSLNRSYLGLYVPRMIWRSIENFSTNSLALIVADQLYDAKDYIYHYEEFLQAKQP